MEFFPTEAQQNKPKIASGLTLFLCQLAAALVVVLLSRIWPISSGSGLSLVGVTLASFAYAMWAEQKRPDSLAVPSMTLWLSVYAALGQVLFALPFFLLLRVPLRFVAMFLPFAFVLGFAFSWLGLWQGRRVEAKRREKLRGNL